MDTERSKRNNPSLVALSRYLFSWRTGCSLSIGYREDSPEAVEQPSNLLLSENAGKVPKYSGVLFDET